MELRSRRSSPTRRRPRWLVLVVDAALVVGAYLGAAAAARALAQRQAEPSGRSGSDDSGDGPRGDEPMLPGRPRLLMKSGNDEGTVPSSADAARGLQRAVVLGPGRLVLGSGEHADLRLDDPRLAGAHVEVVCDGDDVRLHDLTGTGQVLVDGVPVLDAHLVDGNRVTVAGHDLVFRRDTHFQSGGRQGGEGS